MYDGPAALRPYRRAAGHVPHAAHLVTGWPDRRQGCRYHVGRLGSAMPVGLNFREPPAFVDSRLSRNG